MKKIIYIIVSFVLVLSLPSCEGMMGDFLDKAPGVDVTADTIFSSKTQVETAVAAMYRYGIHSILPRRQAAPTIIGGSLMAPSAAACDEAESGQTWVDQQAFNAGDITAENITTKEDRRFSARFVAIRQANILMTRVSTVPGLAPDYINQIKGEALFVRALNKFEMFKRYGGIPIIDSKLEVSDNFAIPRSSVSVTVESIKNDCNEAIGFLPNTYPSSMRGRVTKGAAMALKSRLLLYASSPLFNTVTPYISMDDPANNNLICYGDVDNNRWKAAADASKDVIDWATGNGVSLIADKGVDANYRFVFEKNDNAEVILANKMYGEMTVFQIGPWQLMIPAGFDSRGWNIGNQMTVNFVKKYEKQDGTTMVWENTGTDAMAAFASIDRRYMQSVASVGTKWNDQINPVRADEGGAQAVKSNPAYTGMWVMKFIPQSMSMGTGPNEKAMPNDILFRLGEFYLNYAEALNEFNSTPPAEAYIAVNTIRARSGQPDLPSGLTKEQFRVRVQNERAVELYFEDHRFWDIRRWKIAEQDGVMQGDFFGFKFIGTPSTSPTMYSYEIIKIENRTFYPKMYLHPFLRSEVLKGYLVQNPGY